MEIYQNVWNVCFCSARFTIETHRTSLHQLSMPPAIHARCGGHSCTQKGGVWTKTRSAHQQICLQLLSTSMWDSRRASRACLCGLVMCDDSEKCRVVVNAKWESIIFKCFVSRPAFMLPLKWMTIVRIPFKSVTVYRADREFYIFHWDE